MRYLVCLTEVEILLLLLHNNMYILMRSNISTQDDDISILFFYKVLYVWDLQIFCYCDREFPLSFPRMYDICFKKNCIFLFRRLKNVTSVYKVFFRYVEWND